MNNSAMFKLSYGLFVLSAKSIVICDHDKCGITEEDETIFRKNGISLFKAIEFTTKEGIHIIGISPEIKQLKKESCYYSVEDLFKKLLLLNIAIIIPHPFHETGLIGNSNSTEKMQKYVLQNANGIEIDNYRYGSSKEIESILYTYHNLKGLYGSDAHAKKQVGAYYNIAEISDRVEFNDKGFKEILNEVRYSERRYTSSSFNAKSIKRCKIYQKVLNMFDAELRRKIKNRFLNK